MSDPHSERFGLIRPGHASVAFGKNQERGYTKRSLSYDDYMEVLSILKSLENVVGTRQISDYMNALRVAQRNSPVDIDPANVILSMGKLYSEKRTYCFTDASQNQGGFLTVQPESGRASMTYGQSGALQSGKEKAKYPGNFNGPIASAFREIGYNESKKRELPVQNLESKQAYQDTKSYSGSLQPHPGRQAGHQPVPPHLMRSQLQRNHGAPMASVGKQITNGSYLLRFNVTTDLGRLLPEHKDNFPDLCLIKDAPRSLFKRNISVIDNLGRLHCVKYEGIVSSKQRHNRLTTGWSGVVKSLGIKVGDTVVFERWTSNPSILHISIIQQNDDLDYIEEKTKKSKKDVIQSAFNEMNAISPGQQE